MNYDDDDNMSQTSQTSEWKGFASYTESNNHITPINHRRTSTISTDSEGKDIRPTIALLRTKDYSNVSRIAERDHLTDDNWHEWKDHMLRVLWNCDIAEYVTGFKERPNPDTDPIGTRNWDKNDVWAQQVIINNVTASQMNHISSKQNSKEMYSALS